MKPTDVLAIAPAIKFPWLESFTRAVRDDKGVGPAEEDDAFDVEPAVDVEVDVMF